MIGEVVGEILQKAGVYQLCVKVKVKVKVGGDIPGKVRTSP